MIFWFFWQAMQIFLPLALYLASIWCGAHLVNWLLIRLSWHLGWRTDRDPVTGKIRGSKRFWRWAIIHLKPRLDELFKKQGPEQPATFERKQNGNE